MTILSPQTLQNVIELVEAGASTVETTAAIGAAPKSKIIFAWLKSSEAAADFDAPPDPLSLFCVTRNDKLVWFHDAYREAVEYRRSHKKRRAARPSPLRAEMESRLAARLADPTPSRPQSPLRLDLEARLAAKREGIAAAVEPSAVERQATPATITAHVPQRPAVLLDPPAPAPIPAYAYRRAKSLDDVHDDNGPPPDGRFLITADRPKSIRERMAGTLEITDTGVRRW